MPFCGSRKLHGAIQEKTAKRDPVGQRLVYFSDFVGRLKVTVAGLHGQNLNEPGFDCKCRLEVLLNVNTVSAEI